MAQDSAKTNAAHVSSCVAAAVSRSSVAVSVAAVRVTASAEIHARGVNAANRANHEEDYKCELL